MKQNEKILVYAVTGFLVVILMLAVLLGTSDGKRGAGAGGNSPGGNPSSKDVAALSLEDLLGNPAGNPASDARGDHRGTSAGHGDADRPAANGDPAGDPTQAAGDKPLLTNVQLLPPTAEAMVTEKLGLRRKVNGFCIVTAQPKDTLSTLVQKWCGKTDDYLEQAHGLNEELSTLHVGQEVTLPWVDAEVLLAAINARGDKTGPAVPATAGGAGDAHVAAVDADAGKETKDAGKTENKAPDAKAAAGTRKITLKAGDTLWKIAEREVGRKAAGRFLSQIRELNPGIDPDHLREGVEIRLPATENHPEAGRPTN